MAAQSREAKNLIETLVDKKCEVGDIQDIYRSVFNIKDQGIKIYTKPSKANF